MAYSIRIESYFSAAHRLRGYEGKCESLHGHNWKVEAVISSEKLGKVGMVLDFKKAKSLLSGIVSQLDHQELNKIAHFKKHNPTSELIAEFIFKKYEKKFKLPLALKSVTVWETPTSSATFCKD